MLGGVLMETKQCAEPKWIMVGVLPGDPPKVEEEIPIVTDPDEEGLIWIRTLHIPGIVEPPRHGIYVRGNLELAGYYVDILGNFMGVRYPAVVAFFLVEGADNLLEINLEDRVIKWESRESARKRVMKRGREFGGVIYGREWFLK